GATVNYARCDRACERTREELRQTCVSRQHQAGDDVRDDHPRWRRECPSCSDHNAIEQKWALLDISWPLSQEQGKPVGGVVVVDCKGKGTRQARRGIAMRSLVDADKGVGSLGETEGGDR